jgi:hypothetical protein
MSQIEITRVESLSPSPRLIGESFIDWPQVGVASPACILRFAGWALPRKIPIKSIQISCLGSVLRSVPFTEVRPDVAKQHPGAPEKCGFVSAISELELPPEFELVMRAVLEDGQRIPIAIIRGKHNHRPASTPSPMRPIMVTALGRSGTTYLMRLLSEHPEIVAHRAYPYETRAAAHWMHLLRVMIQLELPGQPIWRFDRGDWNQPPFAMPHKNMMLAANDYLANEYPVAAAEFCRQSIQQFYRHVAVSQQQPKARFFCEKFTVRGLEFLLQNVFPDSKEIFLVRDFRDMACSSLAFNNKRGFAGFGRELVDSDEKFFPELKGFVEMLRDHYTARRKRAHLVRYEELIRQTPETFRKILEYLEVESSESTINAIIQRATTDTPTFVEHRTTSSVEESIGRWHSDFPPALQRLCRDSFDKLLPEFGYRLDRKGQLVLP